MVGAEQILGTARYWEDFSVGDVYVHQRARTATSLDNYVLTLGSVNTANTHIYLGALANMPSNTFRDLPLPGWAAIASLVVGLTSADMCGAVVQEIGFDNVRVMHPVYAGHTIRAESEVLSASEVERDDVGLLRYRAKAFNQDDVQVWQGEHLVLTRRRQPRTR